MSSKRKRPEPRTPNARPMQLPNTPLPPGHQAQHGVTVTHQELRIEQSPIPSAEMLDGLSRHIVGVGERWMTIFEGQVKHEQSIAKESLRVNEEANKRTLALQETAITGENRRLMIAQLIAGALLLIGVLFLVGALGAALYFFREDKGLAGTVAIAVASAFGYYFRGVFKTYFPGMQSQSKK